MTSKIEVEEFRKAVLFYKIAAEKFIWATYNKEAHEAIDDDDLGFRSPLYEAFRAAQSALVVTCHQLPAAAFLLSVLEEGQRPILRIHSYGLRSLSEDQKADEFDPLSVVIDALEQIQRLELFGGLCVPIETREFSRWYWTTDILKRAGKNGEAMPDRTWQKHRKRLGNQIMSHPQSGAQKVRVTRMANDDLALNLPDFPETVAP